MNRIQAEKRYECTSCGAVHHYQPEQCQRCKLPGTVQEKKKEDSKR